MRREVTFSESAVAAGFVHEGGVAPGGTGEMSDRIVYWHRELPPLDADPIGEHVLEAASCRVPGTIAHRDDLWLVCYEDLMRQAQGRLEQEAGRLGGHYAHVTHEVVDSRHDPATGEAWLHGRFDYVLFRRSAEQLTR